MDRAECELCGQQAFVYCTSDSAFLCWDCDAEVHQANFLVARHVRHRLCHGDDEAGSGSGDDDSSSSAFSSSACVSSSTGKLRKIDSYSSSLTQLSRDEPTGRVPGVNNKRKREEGLPLEVDAKVEGIFVNWSRRFGGHGNAVVSSASQALVFCLGRSTVSPLRVALAASFWFGLRLCGDRALTWQEQLRRVEEISGVAGKQILAAESKLARALRAPQDLKEGWAEC